MRADDTAAEHHDLRRANAGDAAHQHAAAAGRAAKRNGRGLDGQTAGDLAHRREQRKTAGRIGHGLIGDRGRAGRHQAAGLLRIGREVKIGEEDLVRLEPAILDGLRLLDLDDHLGLGEHGFCRGQDARAGLLIVRVVGEDAGAGAGLHEDFVAARRQLAHRARYEPNPELITLDLSRNADAHDVLRFQDGLSLTSRLPQSGKRLLAFYRAKANILQ